MGSETRSKSKARTGGHHLTLFSKSLSFMATSATPTARSPACQLPRSPGGLPHPPLGDRALVLALSDCVSGSRRRGPGGADPCCHGASRPGREGWGWEEQTATLNKAFTRHPSLCLPRHRKNLLTTSPVPPAALADPLRQDSVSNGARD